MDESCIFHAAFPCLVLSMCVVPYLVRSGDSLLMETLADKTMATSGGRDKPKFALGAYFQMMKPTISLLVVFTTVPTLFMSAETMPSLSLIFAVLMGTFLASSSASIFNHLLDEDVDATMERTRNRPLPSGAVHSEWATFLGLLLGTLSFLLLAVVANPLTAWLGLIANLFYVFIYTMWLKRRTPQNIVIGGAAGSIGPLIGWAAVTGTVSWEAWALFLVVFLWTPPHFWALAIKYRDDYSKANIPMLPSVHGVETTRRQMFYYTLTLVPVTASLYFYSTAGMGYFLVSMAASLYFCYLAFRLMVTKKEEHVMPVFFFSLLYIFVIFGALAVEQFIYLL